MAEQHSNTADFESRYKFNNLSQLDKVGRKELQDELGLAWYDYGARNYDTAVARFMNLDPLTEKYHTQSPFVYADNNPVMFRDINGEGTDDEWIQFSTGETVKVGDKGGKNIDYITRINEDGSVTNITQSGGKMKETGFFAETNIIPKKYREQEDYDVTLNQELINATSIYGDLSLSSSVIALDNPNTENSINLDYENVMQSVTVGNVTIGPQEITTSTQHGTYTGIDTHSKQMIMGISTPMINNKNYSLEVKMDKTQAKNFIIAVGTAILTRKAINPESVFTTPMCSY